MVLGQNVATPAQDFPPCQGVPGQDEVECGVGDAIGPMVGLVWWLPSLHPTWVVHPQGMGDPNQEELSGMGLGSVLAVGEQWCCHPSVRSTKRCWRSPKAGDGPCAGTEAAARASPTCRQASRAAPLGPSHTFTARTHKLRHFQDILVSVSKGE